MPTPHSNPSPHRWLVWTVTALAAAVGLFYGFEFGNRLSGMLLGIVLALNCAVFCSILVAGAAEWFVRRLGRAGSD